MTCPHGTRVSKTWVPRGIWPLGSWALKTRFAKSETESQKLGFKLWWLIVPCGGQGNRVSKTRFQIGYFSKITPHTDHFPLSLTLSHTEQTHSHAFTHHLTLTLNSVTHSLHSHSLTFFSHSLFSHSISTLSLHYSTFIAFAKRFDQATASFEFLQSTRSLKTKNKGELLCTKFTVWLPKNSGKNQRNFGFMKFFSILVSVLNF